jgi:hypothetical protein
MAHSRLQHCTLLNSNVQHLVLVLSLLLLSLLLLLLLL